MDHTAPWTGIACAGAAAALFGASTPLAKLLLPGVEPVMMAGLLYLGSGLGLAVSQWSSSAKTFHAFLVQFSAAASLPQSCFCWD